MLGEGSHVVNPNGDCTIHLDRAEKRATISVPGTAHLLSADLGRVNAPRILREIRGDFEVRVKVTGTSHPGGRKTTTQYAPYHGAGILLWQDRSNYVRLEIASEIRKGKVFSYANFELRQDGLLVTSRGLEIVDGASDLRLRRRADEIHGAFSLDGDHWTPLAPIVAKLEDRVEIGVVAVNSSSKPLKAEFEGFAVPKGRGATTTRRPPDQSSTADERRAVAGVKSGACGLDTESLASLATWRFDSSLTGLAGRWTRSCRI